MHRLSHGKWLAWLDRSLEGARLQDRGQDLGKKHTEGLKKVGRNYKGLCMIC